MIELLANRRKAGKTRRKGGRRCQQEPAGIASIYIEDLGARVDKDKITTYRITAKVTFEVEGTK